MTCARLRCDASTGASDRVMLATCRSIGGTGDAVLVRSMAPTTLFIWSEPVSGIFASVSVVCISLSGYCAPRK